jgi:5-methylcytosine-specific restriction endonuclease McrA
MQRAKQVCRVPGCGALCDGAYCGAHAGGRSNLSQGPRRPRLYDRRRWRDRLQQAGDRARPAVQDPSAVRRWGFSFRNFLRKLRVGVPAISTEADHIIPISRGGDESMENLQGACHACHSHKTASGG